MALLKITPLELAEIKIIEPAVFRDTRGYSCETYSSADLKAVGINCNFILDYQSFSQKKGTLRGIHFQNAPCAQAKIMRVLTGSLLDVVVDLRKNSPNYGKWTSIPLSAADLRQIFIPRGFGHGFVTLEDNTAVFYKLDDYYNADAARTIRWNDPDLAIDWKIDDPIVSDKDANGSFLNECDIEF